MGGPPTDLSAHEEGKGPVWKTKEPLGEGKSQRCSRFAAIQEVPLGKGRDIPCLKKLVPGDWVCRVGTSPREMQKTFTPETELAFASWSRAWIVWNLSECSPVPSLGASASTVFESPVWGSAH